MTRKEAFRSVLIFGGAGFIGSNWAEWLLQNTEAKVHIFDNLSRMGVRHNLRALEKLSGRSRRLQVTVGDIRDAEMVDRAVRHATEIYHFAAQVAVTTSVLAPRLDFDINLAGTFNILEAARKSGNQPFLLFTSTNKVYGCASSGEVWPEKTRCGCSNPNGTSETQPLDFHSPYGCSKGAADQYVRDYARIYGLNTTVFRMSCIAGPGQFGNEDQGWVAHFLYSALSRQPVTIYGDGLQVRDVLDVADLVRAFEAVRSLPRSNAGRVYNVGGGSENSVSLLELMAMIQELTGRKLETSFHGLRPGDQAVYISNTQKLWEETGWKPEITIPQTLERIHRWWKQNRGLFAPARVAEMPALGITVPLGSDCMMKFALVNPNWTFEGSTYFGCRDPHYPLELLFAYDQLRAAGHEPLLIDAQMDDLSIEQSRAQVQDFRPDFLIIPTAPSYLFWRCPQPELRVPMQWFAALGKDTTKVAIGPHGSANPAATLRKLNCRVVLRGEPDQTIPELATKPWQEIVGCCYRLPDGSIRVTPSLGVTDMKALPPLDFHNYSVERHQHRHHVFNGEGRGAELEFARGCPWACSFCNKTLFRNKFRERSVEAVLTEVDRLVRRGVDYFYFIDEIFGVGKNVLRLLEGLAERKVKIGFQTRIDLWNEATLELLGRAGCISMECGIESITDEGRDELNKNCRISTERITELLIYARGRIPWVQANLILTDKDDKNEIRRWQDYLKTRGVWVSEPVPMFPFPGSPSYIQVFGSLPDDEAWERAHRHYLSLFGDKGFSDIQDQRPLSIEELETAA